MLNSNAMTRRDFFSALAASAAAVAVLPVGFPEDPMGNDDWRFLQGLIDDAARRGVPAFIPDGKYVVNRVVRVRPHTHVYMPGAEIVDGRRLMGSKQ